MPPKPEDSRGAEGGQSQEGCCENGGADIRGSSPISGGGCIEAPDQPFATELGYRQREAMRVEASRNHSMWPDAQRLMRPGG